MIKKFINEKTIKRRSFLKLAGLSSVGLSLGFPLTTLWGKTIDSENREIKSESFFKKIWHRNKEDKRYFITPNLKTNWIDKNIILAKVDGWWRAYSLREFDNEFHEWWIAEKLWYYDQLIAFFEGETDELNIPNGGHHHPMLSTYGNKKGRGDSDFHLNTTPKGFSLLPKPDKIDYVTQQIEAVYNDPDAKIPVDIFKKRKELYQQKDLWDKTRFVTLELYSGRPIDEDDKINGELINFGFLETHTFQNLIKNPMATLTYMSLFNTDGSQSYFEGREGLTPTFEFRGFCWLISYHNPNLTEYEKAIADYVNQAHCRYHGGRCDLAANIFLIVEQFNNTPGYDPYGRGRRSVPPYDYGVSSAITIKPKKKLTLDEKINLIKMLRIPV